MARAHAHRSLTRSIARSLHRLMTAPADNCRHRVGNTGTEWPASASTSTDGYPMRHDAHHRRQHRQRDPGEPMLMIMAMSSMAWSDG
jgi:hypothetical protein